MDLQLIVLLIIFALAQAYIGYTIYRLTDEWLAVVTAIVLPLGLGLYFVQIFILERMYPSLNVGETHRDWLKMSYFFVFVEYMAAIILYLDFISYIP